jgi:CheY-like chemotaxis protein
MSDADDQGSPRGRLLIYVVDDQEIFAEVVAAILRSEDYDTETFDSAEVAVAALEREPRKPDFVITDYVMPGMSGMELIIKCRTLIEGVHTILFSGQVDNGVVEKYAVKPDRFVRKPFEPSELLDAISSLRI